MEQKEEGRHRHNSSQDGDRKGLSVQPGKRTDWLEADPVQALQKFGKLICYFESGPGPSQAQDDIQGLAPCNCVFILLNIQNQAAWQLLKLFYGV